MISFVQSFLSLCLEVFLFLGKVSLSRRNFQPANRFRRRYSSQQQQKKLLRRISRSSQNKIQIFPSTSLKNSIQVGRNPHHRCNLNLDEMMILMLRGERKSFLRLFSTQTARIATSEIFSLLLVSRFERERV